MRDERGFSIILVASLGTILVLSALAVTSGLIPVYKNIGNQNFQTQTLAAAEVGVQYAISQLNASSDPNTVTTLNVPSTMTNASVSVTVDPIAPTQTLLGNYLNQAYLNYSNDKTTGYTMDVRRITSQATYGLSKSTIYVFVENRPGTSFNPPPENPSGQKNLNPKTFFNNALFASNQLVLNNVDPNTNKPLPSSQTLTVNSENGTRVAQVGSNTNVTFVGNTSVDGSVVANNPGKTASVTGSSTNKIGGNLTYNGVMSSNGSNASQPAFIADNFQNIVTYGFNNINVLGDGRVGIFTQPGTISAQTTTTPMVPSLSASNSTNLGVINVAANQTLTIPAGNYTANSITVQPGGQILTAAAADGSATGVVINVTGATASDAAIDIGGKGISNSFSNAQNLQIFYGGAKQVNVSMSSNFSQFYGLIYAPNADVSLTMTGQDFHGAIASNNLNIGGYGRFWFDPATVGLNPGAAPSLNDATQNAKNNLFFNATPLNNNPNHGYSVISWYEPAINP